MERNSEVFIVVLFPDLEKNDLILFSLFFGQIGGERTV